jgi:hypothetical protein
VLDAMLFSGALAKQLLEVTDRFVVSVCLSVCQSMYQSHSHTADFLEVAYLRFLQKFVDTFQFVKSGQK